MSNSILQGEDTGNNRQSKAEEWRTMMVDLLKSARFFLTLIVFACLAVLATAEYSDAKTVACQMRGAVAGPTRDGKQLITFTAVFQNVSQHEYVSRVNWVEVEVHGYWGNGREEKYRRKVNVDWDFSPALEPSQRKSLNIKFKRKVDSNRGMHTYDDVEIRVLNINFSRAS